MIEYEKVMRITTLEKFSTKGVLVRRGILEPNEVIYPICLVYEEFMNHLLIHFHNH